MILPEEPRTMSQSKTESEALHDRVAELIDLLHSNETEDSAQDVIPDLRRLHDEIERWTDREEEVADRSWIERLRNLVEQIEIDHPQAVHVIGRISHSLSELGI